MNNTRVLLAAAVAAAVSATPASAVVSHHTAAHANMCMPATNDLTRGTNGIRNNTTGNRSVYCGFEGRDYDSDYYNYVSVVLRNYGSVTRTVNCYWTSGYPLSGGYSSASVAAYMPADGGAAHEFALYNFSKPTVGSGLGLRCVLPPDTAMDLITVEAHDPSPT
jgi:hypothetical protein